MKKICKICDIEKDESQFDWSRPRPGEKYRRTICKVCQAQKHREWRAKHVQSWLEFLEFDGIEIKCQYCRFGDKSTYAALDFHHLDPDTKENVISPAIQKLSIENERVPEIIRTIKEDCIILCSNCHRLVHSGNIILEGK